MRPVPKIFLTLAILATAAVSHAQSSWTLRGTPDGSGTIYRTEVYGTQTRDKTTRRARTALSLVCGATLSQPMIMLQWEGMTGYGIRRVNYSIDNRPLTPNGSGKPMSAENDILYTAISSSQELLQSMKSGSTLTVDWVGLDQTRYLTVFNLSTFRSNLSEFNKRCNTEV